MLGFGELFAHEIAFRLGWGGTRVWPPVFSSEVGKSSEKSGQGFRKGTRAGIGMEDWDGVDG